MKSHTFVIKIPRKKKKQLKKLGKYPQLGFVYVVENNITANINNVIFGKP